MRTNGTNQMPNTKAPMTNQYQNPNDKNPRPQTNNDEAQRRRAEVLNKIRTSQNGNVSSQMPRPAQLRPPAKPQNSNGQNQAKPASWRNPVARKNVIDLRNGKIKNKRDLFFTA